MGEPHTVKHDELERLVTAVPGPRTRELARRLRASESQNVTFVHARFPVFWASAQDATVTDVDGNRYIDLTAAFGVANTGHSNARVVQAVRTQCDALMHAMGDVHPTATKVELLEVLAAITPGALAKSFLGTTGSEAVEAALKTAVLATGKTAFAAYRGAYHGLSLGALRVSGVPKFRDPFAALVGSTTLLFDYPRERDEAHIVRDALRARPDVGALIIEPIQGRGGGCVAPAGYLADLREICSSLDVLLIFDEIYTGFGRTGTMFACEYDVVVPDMLCIGKAMGSGFPISAMIGTAQVMDAWPVSTGEALHTSTYLGQPMGCAAALATVAELNGRQLPERASALGAQLRERLSRWLKNPRVRDVRGRGLMWAVEVESPELAQRTVFEALSRGIIALAAGPRGDVLSITPPLVISEHQLFHAIDIIEESLHAAT